jgi:hypothetical protein
MSSLNERAEHQAVTGDDPGDAQHDCPQAGDGRAEPQLLQLQPTCGQGDNQLNKAIQPLTITRAGPRCVEFHQPDIIVPLLTSQQLGKPSGDRDQAEQLEGPPGERAEHQAVTGDDPGDAQHDCPQAGDGQAEPQPLPLQPKCGQGDDRADQTNNGPSDKTIQPLTIMRAVARCVEFHPSNNNFMY